jgi:mono/diheme cytochrome c family protein
MAPRLPLPTRAMRAGWVAVALATLAALLGACAQQRPLGERRADAAVAAPPPADTLLLRQRLRELAKVHCGSCHQASLPTAKPAALAIHNLDADDWPATLSAAQLERGFTRRLEARLDDQDRRWLRAFVESEVALRRGAK